MAHCCSRQPCQLRALVIDRCAPADGEGLSIDVDVCPGAILYGVRLESTDGPVTLKLADTSWSIPADRVECFDVAHAAWPTSAKLLIPPGSCGRLTIIYTQGGPGDLS